MIFDVHNETEILEDGTICYDAANQIEASSVAELARMVEEGEVKEFNGVEINMILNIDDSELLVEIFLPFTILFQYKFIEQSVAAERRVTVDG